jgi:hypothetical protein
VPYERSLVVSMASVHQIVALVAEAWVEEQMDTLFHLQIFASKVEEVEEDEEVEEVSHHSHGTTLYLDFLFYP